MMIMKDRERDNDFVVCCFAYQGFIDTRVIWFVNTWNTMINNWIKTNMMRLIIRQDRLRCVGDRCECMLANEIPSLQIFFIFYYITRIDNYALKKRRTRKKGEK